MKLTKAEYEVALEAARVASQKFGAAQKAYRSLEIGDAEFLAAKAEYDASGVAFDVARGEVVKACEGCGESTENLTLLQCMGGAAGDTFLCPACFAEHCSQPEEGAGTETCEGCSAVPVGTQVYV